MATIALIGPDGAGKTTLTGMLAKSGLFPIKCIYMGVNISASNVALPTTRLAAVVRRRRERGMPNAASARRSRRPRRVHERIWSTVGMLNRLADAWYRQFVAWWYEFRGYVVLYDRHFALDFVRDIAARPDDPVERRLYHWCLTHLYPKPDAVIYLDAPGTALFARKGESTAQELERRRQAFLAQGQRLPCFRCVDATRSLPEVYAEVAGHIEHLLGLRASGASEDLS